MARKKKKRKKGRDATSAWLKGRPTIGDDPLLIKRRVDLRRRKVIGMRDFWGGQHYRPYPNRILTLFLTRVTREKSSYQGPGAVP
ncbi:hypothetical protein E4U14_004161 [Claviceps sp. LM454 group G7]|nr:hypothetical protein E4U14_004161 [Claviceps sp. LM454 group G7]